MSEKLRTTDATEAFNKPLAASIQVKRGLATMKRGVYRGLEIFARLRNVNVFLGYQIGPLADTLKVRLSGCELGAFQNWG